MKYLWNIIPEEESPRARFFINSVATRHGTLSMRFNNGPKKEIISGVFTQDQVNITIFKGNHITFNDDEGNTFTLYFE